MTEDAKIINTVERKSLKEMKAEMTAAEETVTEEKAAEPIVEKVVKPIVEEAKEEDLPKKALTKTPPKDAILNKKGVLITDKETIKNAKKGEEKTAELLKKVPFKKGGDFLVTGNVKFMGKYYKKGDVVNTPYTGVVQQAIDAGAMEYIEK